MYKNKYLKYKNKYLILKGGMRTIAFVEGTQIFERDKKKDEEEERDDLLRSDEDNLRVVNEIMAARMERRSARKPRGKEIKHITQEERYFLFNKDLITFITLLGNIIDGAEDKRVILMESVDSSGFKIKRRRDKSKKYFRFGKISPQHKFVINFNYIKNFFKLVETFYMLFQISQDDTEMFKKIQFYMNITILSLFKIIYYDCYENESEPITYDKFFSDYDKYKRTTLDNPDYKEPPFLPFLFTHKNFDMFNYILERLRLNVYLHEDIVPEFDEIIGVIEKHDEQNSDYIIELLKQETLKLETIIGSISKKVIDDSNATLVTTNADDAVKGNADDAVKGTPVINKDDILKISIPYYNEIYYIKLSLPTVLEVPTVFPIKEYTIESIIEENTRYEEFKKILISIDDKFKKLQYKESNLRQKSKFQRNYWLIRLFIDKTRELTYETADMDLDFIMFVIVVSLYKNLLCDSLILNEESIMHIFNLVLKDSTKAKEFIIINTEDYVFFHCILQELQELLFPHHVSKSTYYILEYILKGDPTEQHSGIAKQHSDIERGDFIIDRILEPSIEAIQQDIDPKNIVFLGVLPDFMTSTDSTVSVPTALPVPTAPSLPTVPSLPTASSVPTAPSLPTASSIPTALPVPTASSVTIVQIPPDLLQKYNKFKDELLKKEGILSYIDFLLRDYDGFINDKFKENYKKIKQFINEINKLLTNDISKYGTINFDFKKYIEIILLSLFKNVFFDSYIGGKTTNDLLNMICDDKTSDFTFMPINYENCLTKLYNLKNNAKIQELQHREQISEKLKSYPGNDGDHIMKVLTEELNKIILFKTIINYYRSSL